MTLFRRFSHCGPNVTQPTCGVSTQIWHGCTSHWTLYEPKHWFTRWRGALTLRDEVSTMSTLPLCSIFSFSTEVQVITTHVIPEESTHAWQANAARRPLLPPFVLPNIIFKSYFACVSGFQRAHLSLSASQRVWGRRRSIVLKSSPLEKDKRDCFYLKNITAEISR